MGGRFQLGAFAADLTCLKWAGAVGRLATPGREKKREQGGQLIRTSLHGDGHGVGRAMREQHGSSGRV